MIGNINRQQAEAAQRLMNAWQNLGQAIESAYRYLREQFEPAVTALLSSFTQLATSISGPDLLPAIKSMSDGIKEFASYLTSPAFVSDMKDFAEGVRNTVSALRGLLQFLGMIPTASANPSDAAAPPAPAVPSPLGSRFGMSDQEMRERWQRSHPDGVSAIERLWRESASPALGGWGRGARPRSLTDRHRQAYSFWLSQGYSREAAAGLVANLHHESGVNPQVRPGDGGMSHGIAQWNRERLQRFMARHGGRLPAQTSLDEQLAFAAWELSPEGPEAAAGRALRGARTAREAGRIASRQWLRPGVKEEDRQREENNRGDTANNFLPALNGAVPRAVPGLISAQRDIGLINGSRAAAALRGGPVSSTSTSTVEVNGPITIHTQATDARGIAQDLTARLRELSTPAQAARGLTP
ncbi:hypothetical protein HMPREF9946_01542 [Acetobacteraceae bacterium AT-5844]|nr:hypothetical protein HMPREF9946_01542 [Acetobacteraceae bacterium AT-5844]